MEDLFSFPDLTIFYSAIAPLVLFMRQAMQASLNDSLGGQVISIAVVFTVLSLVGLIARMVSVHMRQNPCQIDDYLLIVAWFLSAGQSGMCIWGAYYGGLGRHYSTLSPEEIVSFAKVLNFARNCAGTTGS